MSLSKTLFKEKNYVIAKITDVLSADELIDFLFWIIKQKEAGYLQNEYRLLLDATGVDDVQMNEDDIRRISHINMTFGRQRGRLKTAIAVDTEAGRKLAGLHKILSKSANIEVEVFDSSESACQWLAITPNY